MSPRHSISHLPASFELVQKLLKRRIVQGIQSVKKFFLPGNRFHDFGTM